MPNTMKLSPDQLALWKQRFHAVEHLWKQVEFRLNRLRAQINIPNAKEKKHSQMRVDLLEDTLVKLREFGRNHFYFFYHGFDGAHPYVFGIWEGPRYVLNDCDGDLKRYRIKESQWLSATYLAADAVMEVLLDRLTTDALILDQAVDQRFIAMVTGKLDKRGDLSKVKQPFSNSMKVSDRLTDVAITHARSLLAKGYTIEKKNYEAFTYRQTETAIRVVPYSNAVIIGIPVKSVTETGNSIDHLAIPHEVGHYIFWNAIKEEIDTDADKRSSASTKTFRSGLRQIITDRRCDPASQLNFDLDTFAPILEELMSDVMGCLIAGPAAAISLQSLMKSYAGDWFLFDNNRHPVPALRPYIYIDVLYTVAQQTADASLQLIVQDLQQRWDDCLEERNIRVKQDPDRTRRFFYINTIGCDIADAEVCIRENIGEDCATANKCQTTLAQQYDEMIVYMDCVLEMFQIENVPSWPWRKDMSTTDLPRIIDNFKEESGRRANDIPTIPPKDKYWDASKWIDLVTSLFGSDEAHWWNEMQNGHEVKHYLKPSPPVGVTHDVPQITIPADEWITILDAGGWITGPTGGGNAH